jgi:hypothetical protein
MCIRDSVGSEMCIRDSARIAFEYGNRLFLGWTYEAKNSAASIDSDPNNGIKHDTRLRWGGIIGSYEPYVSLADAVAAAGASYGIYGWHEDGYLDLNTKFGELIAAVPFSGGIAVFQENGMTFVRGTPEFDSSGSLDATMVFEKVKINGGFAYDVNQYGLYFVDKVQGPMVFTGSGIPKPLGERRIPKNAAIGCGHVGTLNDHVIFSSDTPSGEGGTLEFWALHIPTNRWTRLTSTSTLALRYLHRANNRELAGFMGGRVVSLDTVVIPDGTATDWDGSLFAFGFTSKTFGAPNVELRPTRMWVTYRSGPVNPASTVTVEVGLGQTIDAAHKAAMSIVTQTSSSGADVDTVHEAVYADRDPGAAVTWSDTGAATTLEVVQVVVDFDVEGEGASS